MGNINKMKFLSLIVLLLALTAIASHKVHHRHHSKTHHRHRGFATNLYQFALGIGASLANNPNGLENCLPAEWKSAQPALEQQTEGQLGQQSSLFGTIVKVLGMGVNLACKVKSTIIGWLQKKLAKRRLRRRFFMTMRSWRGRRRMEKWFISSAWNSVKSAASSVGNAVVSGARAVGNAVVSGAKYVGNAIMNGAAGIFNGVVSTIQSIYKTITDFFKSPLFQQIKAFVMCVKTLVQAIQAIVANIQGFITTVQTLLTGWTGFIQVIINAICNWAAFKQAVDYLIAAFKNSGPARWNQMGRFLGQMVVAIGGSN